MKTKHTPGKWEISNNFNQGIRILVNNEKDNPILMQNICSISGNPKEEEIQANAKLISAAPDLLEAALQIKNEIDTEGLLQHSYDKLLEAIKKATK